MWNKVNKKVEDEMLSKAILFTGNHILYGKAMDDVAFKWKHTMLNNLTNKSINRRAFLGHCAVCYALQIPEYLVRQAWKSLTNKQRNLADEVAEKTIKKWELWYINESQSISKFGKKDVIKKGYQMRLQFK